MNEDKVKKEWIFALKVLNSVYIGIGAAWYRLLEFNPTVRSEVIADHMVGGLAMAICFSLIFYCAYRKGGTRYIGFFLLMQPIHILRGLANIDFVDYLVFFFLATFLCVYTWFCIKTYNLYKLNKYLKEQDSCEKV